MVETNDANKQSVYFSSLGYHIKDIYDIIKESFDDDLDKSEEEQVNRFFTWKNENLPDNQYASIFHPQAEAFPRRRCGRQRQR